MARNSLRNVKSAPYYLCMGFGLAASLPASLTGFGFPSLKTDFGLFFNILPHIFHPLSHFITFRNKLSTRHFELSTTDFKVIHNIMLFFCVFIQSYPHVIHKQAKQTQFCLRMLECKYFKSATCVIELYDLQKDNIHLH